MPNWRHRTAIFSPSSSRAMNFSRSSMELHSFQGIFALPQKAPLCNPCLRNELSPFSQEGQDMSVKAPILKAPPMPVYDWSGCWVSGGIGYGLWNQDHNVSNPG